MSSRIRLLGIALVVGGLFFLAAGGFAYVKTQEGVTSLKAFSAVQNVALSYNEQGQLVDGGSTEEAAVIMSILKDDWKYPVVQSELDPADPVVNTATEYMYQMATITAHIIHGTQTVVLAEDVEYQGEIFQAGTYEFPVDGRYWAGFDRAHPIEGPARGQAWSATAHGLIGELGVGTATASALQLALALAGVLAAVGLMVLFIGLGLVWVSRAMPVPAESAERVTTTGAVRLAQSPTSPR